MSNSKGSILISNANAVGTELVNKLGGTGYTPNEWSDKINLLGIADADIPTALAGITEGSYTGEDRGAIKICNANNVGTMLNKKFNTNRGFKPSEWESAISKLTALTTGTASGSVVSIADGADDVPLTKCEVTLPASLNGYSQVDVVHCGGNILETNAQSKTQNGITWTVNDDGSITLEGTSTARTYLYVHGYHKIISKDTTLTISVEGLKDNGDYDVFVNLPYSDNGVTYTGTYGPCTWDYPTKTINYTNDKYIGFLIDCPANVTTNQTIKVMVSVGSSPSNFEPYTTPTTYNAQLGRTIHGGSADVVNGVGEIGCIRIKFSDLTWNTSLLNGVQQFYALLENTAIPTNNRTILDGLLCAEYTVTYADEVYVDTTVGNKLSVNISKYLQLRDFSVSTLDAFKEKTKDYYLVYPLETSESFTFEPVSINSKKGNNTIWSDSGSNVSVTYYKGV